MALAHLALTLAVLIPQGKSEEVQDPRLTSALTKAEHKSLNSLAKKWYEALKKYEDEESPKKRAKLAKSRERARDKFMKMWRSKEKKEPLKHVGDLLAVFDNVFPYPKQSGTGEIKTAKPKNGDPLDVVVPKGYNKELRYTTVTLVPPIDEDGKWGANKQSFASSWKGVDAAKSWLFVMPRSQEPIELDLLPDLGSVNGNALEVERIKSLLFPLGATQKEYRFDRNKLFLDCSKGSCGFALRLASYFPTRFAGLILRHPVDFGAVMDDGDAGLRDQFRLDTISNLRVALVKSAATAEACDKLSKKLNELRAGSCVVIDETDAELKNKLATFVNETRRDLFSPKVTLVPNHDQFQKGFWVQIDKGETVQSGEEGRPVLVAEADRNANRITITAKNVSTLQLLLNDAIVDLDKEFTVVVNGKAITERRQRSFHTMTEFLSFNLFDPNRVWTTTYTTPCRGRRAPPPGATERSR